MPLCLPCASTTTPVRVLLSVHAPRKQHRTSCDTIKSCAAYSTSSTHVTAVCFRCSRGSIWLIFDCFCSSAFMSSASACRQRGVQVVALRLLSASSVYDFYLPSYSISILYYRSIYLSIYYPCGRLVLAAAGLVICALYCSIGYVLSGVYVDSTVSLLWLLDPCLQPTGWWEIGGGWGGGSGRLLLYV